MHRCFHCLLLCVVLLLSGCQGLGAVADAFTPPELVEAKYELPDKATLIVIDDPRRLVNDAATLRRIAGGARASLEAEEVVTVGFVGQDKLADLREKLGGAYAKTSLAALAIELGAKQVIHAEVTGYQMNVGGGVVRPDVQMNVKVFDLDERGRVFPMGRDPETGIDTGEQAYTLRSRMATKDLSGLGAAQSIAVRDLADQAGRDLGRLFFDWRMPRPGSGISR